jgi:hypothetical protein
MSEFTKQAGRNAKDALKEIMEDFSDEKAGKFFGHCNEIGLFIESAIAEAPKGGGEP